MKAKDSSSVTLLSSLSPILHHPLTPTIAPTGIEPLQMSRVKLPSPLKWRSPWATEKVGAVDSHGR